MEDNLKHEETVIKVVIILLQFLIQLVVIDLLILMTLQLQFKFILLGTKWFLTL